MGDGVEVIVNMFSDHWMMFKARSYSGGEWRYYFYQVNSQGYVMAEEQGGQSGVYNDRVSCTAGMLNAVYLYIQGE